jgi:hypothetical protein
MSKGGADASPFFCLMGKKPAARFHAAGQAACEGLATAEEADPQEPFVIAAFGSVF